MCGVGANDVALGHDALHVIALADDENADIGRG